MLTIAKRTVFDLMWDDRPDQRCWVVKVGKNVVDSSKILGGRVSKTVFLWTCANMCQRLERDGYPCQLRIHDKAGKFQSERTYPDTTRKRKG